MIRVEINIDDLAKSDGDALTQFVIRRKLDEAGIPLGPWGTSTVTSGTLRWRDDIERDVRVIEWIGEKV